MNVLISKDEQRKLVKMKIATENKEIERKQWSKSNLVVK